MAYMKVVNSRSTFSGLIGEVVERRAGRLPTVDLSFLGTEYEAEPITFLLDEVEDVDLADLVDEGEQP